MGGQKRLGAAGRPSRGAPDAGLERAGSLPWGGRFQPAMQSSFDERISTGLDCLMAKRHHLVCSACGSQRVLNAYGISDQGEYDPSDAPVYETGYAIQTIGGRGRCAWEGQTFTPELARALRGRTKTALDQLDQELYECTGEMPRARTTGGPVVVMENVGPRARKAIHESAATSKGGRPLRRDLPANSVARQPGRYDISEASNL